MRLKKLLKLFSFSAFLVLGCCFSAFAARETATYNDTEKVEYEIIDTSLQGERVKKLVVYNHGTESKLSDLLIKRCKKSDINLRSVAYNNLEYNLIKSPGKFGLSLSISMIDPEIKHAPINYRPLEILFQRHMGQGPLCIDEVIIQDPKITSPHSGSKVKVYADGEYFEVEMLNVDSWDSFWKPSEVSHCLGLKKETVFPCCCDRLRFCDRIIPLGQFRNILGSVAESQKKAFLDERARIKKLEEEEEERKTRENLEKKERETAAKEEKARETAARIARLPKSEQLKIQKEKLQRALLTVKGNLIESEEELKKCEHKELVMKRRYQKTADLRGDVTEYRKEISNLEFEIEKITERLSGLKM